MAAGFGYYRQETVISWIAIMACPQGRAVRCGISTLMAQTRSTFATYNGVYHGDGITVWEPFGLQGREIRSLALVDDYLYAGLRNGGVQRRRLTGGTWHPVTSPGWNMSYTVRGLLYDTLPLPGPAGCDR